MSVSDSQLRGEVCSHIYVLRAEYAQQQAEGCASRMEPEQASSAFLSPQKQCIMAANQLAFSQFPDSLTAVWTAN